MSTLDIQKVLELPTTLAPNTLYLVRDTDGQHVMIVITSVTGAESYRTYSEDDIRALIQRYASGGGVGGVDRKLINRLNFGIKLI